MTDLTVTLTRVSAAETLAPVVAPSWGKRLTGLEGLRGVAAFSVMIGHIYSHLGTTIGGLGAKLLAVSHHGLTMFFVLSGFLLYRPFAAALYDESTPMPPIRRYFRNRALRIYPAYLVILIASSFLLQATYTSTNASGSAVATEDGQLGALTNPFVFVTDLTMLQTLFPETMRTGIGVAWSLTTELCFYAVLPGLAMLGMFIARRRRRGCGILAALVVPVALALVGVVGNIWAAATFDSSVGVSQFDQMWGQNWHSVLERSLLTQAGLFAVGCLAATITVALEFGMNKGRNRIVSRVRGASMLVAVPFGSVVLEGLPARLDTFRIENVIVAIACAAVLLVVVLPASKGELTGRPGVAARILDLKPLDSAGRMAYSVYLWHLPVLWWMHDNGLTFTGGMTAFLENVVVVGAVVLVLSMATYRYVELPALRKKKRTDVKTSWRLLQRVS